jgi:oligopeptide transport system ATP-binding protein
VTNDTLVEVTDLVKRFPPRGGPFAQRREVRAVDGVSFAIGRGETLALVGESGSGKTTLGRCILRLNEPTGGAVLFDGMDVLGMGKRELRQMRRRMQMVFQDATQSLNPRLSVGSAISEPIVVHRIASGTAARDRAAELLIEVGLNPQLHDSYPHQLSGGQRQRVGIARALSVVPEFLVLDEPISSLDVSVGAQVLNLLVDLRERRGLTYLLIAHDLAVVRQLARRVAVMYLGRLVELAAADSLYRQPLHPYTASLLAAAPIPDPRATRPKIVVTGEPPSATPLPVGCAFHSRCPHAAKNARCTEERPVLREVEPGRWVACHYGETPVTV